MKHTEIVRAYDALAPSVETENEIYHKVLAAKRQSTRNGRPALRRALLVAACVAVMAILATGGYAAYQKWRLPAPENYVLSSDRSNIDVHDTQVYPGLPTEPAPDTTTPADPSGPAALTDEDFLRKTREVLDMAGVTGVSPETVKVVRQKNLYWDREEVEVQLQQEGEQARSVRFDAESGNLLALFGIEWTMDGAHACHDRAEADALAWEYYRKLPVPQGYTLMSMSVFDEQLWMYEFCREVEPGLFNAYEMVRLGINPQSGELNLCTVFFVPLLDDHEPGDVPLTQAEAEKIALENTQGILDGFTLRSAEIAVGLPNWSFTEYSPLHAKASGVTRLCWKLSYEHTGEFFDTITEVLVDLYTGEILGGDTTG